MPDDPRSPPPPRPPAPSTPLDRAQAGELDADGYLVAKIDEALAPYELAPPLVERMRRGLRASLTVDPRVRRLLTLITGAPPTPFSPAPTARRTWRTR